MNASFNRYGSRPGNRHGKALGKHLAIVSPNKNPAARPPALHRHNVAFDDDRAIHDAQREFLAGDRRLCRQRHDRAEISTRVDGAARNRGAKPSVIPQPDCGRICRTWRAGNISIHDMPARWNVGSGHIASATPCVSVTRIGHHDLHWPAMAQLKRHPRRAVLHQPQARLLAPFDLASIARQPRDHQ